MTNNRHPDTKRPEIPPIPKGMRAPRLGQLPEPKNFPDKLADRLFAINAERLMNRQRNLTLEDVHSYVKSNGINTDDDEVFEHLRTADIPEKK